MGHMFTYLSSNRIIVRYCSSCCSNSSLCGVGVEVPIIISVCFGHFPIYGIKQLKPPCYNPLEDTYKIDMNYIESLLIRASSRT